MTRTHRIILFLIAMLALGTFVFGIMMLKGSGRPRATPPADKAAGSAKSF